MNRYVVLCLVVVFCSIALAETPKDTKPLFVISKDGEYGYINREGKIAIPIQFNSAENFSEGLAVVNFGEDEPYSYIDKSGEIIIDAQFDDARSFSEGLAAVSIDMQWGFIDKTGKFAIEPQFDEAGSFSDGLAMVKNGDL